MAEVVNTNEFKNGMHIELDGSVWRIVEFQHVKPGKGGAFVRTKVKSVDSGAVVDRTFRAGEKFPRVFTEVKNMQYLYDSGDEVVFMDESNYEQLSLPHASLEAELAAWSGHRQVVAVSSGASALQLALTAAGVGPGDEVLVPAFTAAPTASAVCAIGAVPVPVDVDPETALVPPTAWDAARTGRTKAIVVVHLYGRPARIPETDLTVVEDAAHRSRHRRAHLQRPQPPRPADVEVAVGQAQLLGGLLALVLHREGQRIGLGEHRHGARAQLDRAGLERRLATVHEKDVGVDRAAGPVS